MIAEGFRDKIFDIKLVAALGRALGDEDYDTKSSAFEIFTAAIAQGAPHHFHGIFNLTYLLSEGVRDKIFTPEIIAAPHR